MRPGGGRDEGAPPGTYVVHMHGAHAWQMSMRFRLCLRSQTWHLFQAAAGSCAARHGI